MRKYIYGILGLTFAIENAVLVLSCQPINDDDQTRYESKEIRVRQDAKVDSSKFKMKFNIIKRYSGDITGSSYDLIEIEHDHCRYLIMEGYGETLEFIQKSH